MLRQLPQVSDPDLLVGHVTNDDAAVYRITDDIALVQTVDFFPPIVDEPYVFGEIAATNALSDVYAMGGRPILALNIVGFPVGLPLEALGEILRGGASKASEAGVVIAGGHTIDDSEPKYGLAVTGLIEPGRQVTNAGARPGDQLVLTKPIGTGIITTAGKQQQAGPRVLAGAVDAMRTLNEAAAAAMMKVGVNACTDITGYGLLGHLLALVRASDVSARIWPDAVPLLDGALELLEKGIAPGGTYKNFNSVDPLAVWGDSVAQATRLLLCDAQTSGGLPMAVSPERRDRLLAELKARGVKTVAVVGQIIDRDSLGGRRLEVTV